MKILILIFFSFLNFNLKATEEYAAKIILFKGKGTIKRANQQTLDVKNDLTVNEGDTITTEDKSMVKLLFIDKSQIVIGPNSSMNVAIFNKSNPGVVSLIKGQIRSMVSKDYLENNEHEKSKLYIKTNTAALGVRGTNFQVIFNEKNQNTALITFEGKVLFSHFDNSIRPEHIDQRDLEKMITSESAVAVTEGQVSAINLNLSAKAMLPTMLGITQLKALEQNENIVQDEKKSTTKEIQYRNPIPPGVDSKSFTNVSEKGAQSLSENMDKANSFFNLQNGEYKLPAGSIIDLTTVNLVPPPENAVFDPNSKTFIVPEDFGKINEETGAYEAPQGLKLNDNGKFQVVDPDAYMKSKEIVKEKPADDRSPASATTKTIDSSKIDLPKVYDANPEMSKFSNIFNQAPTSEIVIPTEELKTAIEDRIEENQAQRETNSNIGTGGTSRNVQFDITVE